MVVFAFSPTPSGYVVSSGNSTAWQSCTDSLQEKIRGAHEQNHIVEGLSIGNNNDWFLNTNKFVSCSPSSLVHNFLGDPVAKAENLALNQIETFVFTPNPKSYFCKAKGRIFWNDLPESLVTDIRLHASNSGIQCVAVGLGNKWVVVHGNGSMAWHGLGSALADTLRHCRPKKAVKFITLSLDVDDYYFIEFDDGSTAYRLSTAWQTSIDGHTVQAQTIHLAQQDLEDAQRTQRAANDMLSTQRSIDLLNMATRMADKQTRFNMRQAEYIMGGEEVIVERRYII